MKKPETRLKERVQADLKTLSNRWFYKADDRSTRGIHDIILCLNSWFISLELKSQEHLELDDLQQYNATRIRSKAKGLAFRVTPGTWPIVFALLQELDRASPVLPSQLCASLRQFLSQ